MKLNEEVTKMGGKTYIKVFNKPVLMLMGSWHEPDMQNTCTCIYNSYHIVKFKGIVQSGGFDFEIHLLYKHHNSLYTVFVM